MVYAFLEYFQRKLRTERLKKTEKFEVERYTQRVKFYKKLDLFGYRLRLKPTKIFRNGSTTVKKANCDVDLTFDLMRYMSQYSEIVMLSGDGDFAPVLEYLKNKRKKVHILARSERTAREIRVLAGDKFMDFKYLREQLKIQKAPV
ncbi:MAG: NYN domain-containing protein [Patescibacteria group bacterium]